MIIIFHSSCSLLGWRRHCHWTDSHRKLPNTHIKNIRKKQPINTIFEFCFFSPFGLFIYFVNMMFVWCGAHRGVRHGKHHVHNSICDSDGYNSIDQLAIGSWYMFNSMLITWWTHFTTDAHIHTHRHHIHRHDIPRGLLNVSIESDSIDEWMWNVIWKWALLPMLLIVSKMLKIHIEFDANIV